jgi:DNA-binding transcriptional MerR regulator
MAGLMPIGRFAKLSRLTVKTLRHYDECGLLVPARVDARTGYRYYRLSQIRDARIISLLRSLDLPIDEIRLLLTERDTLAARDILQRHRERTRERLAAAQRTLSFIERLLKEDFPMRYDVQVTDKPARPALVLRFRSSQDRLGQDIGVAMRTLADAARQARAHGAGPPVIIWSHQHNGSEIAYEGLACQPVRELMEPSGDAVLGEVPGGRFASAVHTGPFEELGAAYEAVAAWIEEHRHHIAGPPQQTYLTAHETDPARYRTEIAFPIR